MLERGRGTRNTKLLMNIVAGGVPGVVNVVNTAIPDAVDPGTGPTGRASTTALVSLTQMQSIQKAYMEEVERETDDLVPESLALLGSRIIQEKGVTIAQDSTQMTMWAPVQPLSVKLGPPLARHQEERVTTKLNINPSTVETWRVVGSMRSWAVSIKRLLNIRGKC